MAVGPVVISVRRRHAVVSDDPPNSVLGGHLLRHAELFPELAEIVQTVLDAEPESRRRRCSSSATNTCLSSTNPRETQKRNPLERLRASDPHRDRERVVARGDRVGRPGREPRTTLRRALEQSIEEHEQLYEARAGMIQICAAVCSSPCRR